MNRYLYSSLLTYMYMSVLIRKMTVTRFVAPVESLDTMVQQGLAPLMFKHSSQIGEWQRSDDPLKR